MKKILLLILFTVQLNDLFASHAMGGEITWTCQGSMYVFNVKFYRDCNGIQGPTLIDLSTNVPGVSLIPCSLISQTDISPSGNANSGNAPCPTCLAGGIGAAEAYTFQSAGIALPGTPPAGGWAFWWGDCCRSNSATNISNGGGFGYALRAKMYPFPGFVAGQCTDASPFLATPPAVAVCTGYQVNFNNNGVDRELDSLVYSWDYPIDDIPYPWSPIIPYAPPYSLTNQFPGSPTLDNRSGEITYLPLTGGYFVTVVKVAAYKCGVIAAEIWREITFTLENGCSIPAAGNPPNNPATITPPFIGAGGPNTSYERTVCAGDSVEFTLPATDFDILPPANSQDIVFNASGAQFGTGFTSTTGGCPLPPCATLTPAPPLSVPAFMQVNFKWVTSIAHLICYPTYYFYFNIKDNFCPSPALNYRAVAITVLPPNCSSTGLNEHSGILADISIYPDPFIETLSVKINDNSCAQITLYDISARKLLQKSFRSFVSINTMQLAQGIYYYELKNKNGVLKQGKILKGE